VYKSQVHDILKCENEDEYQMRVESHRCTFAEHFDTDIEKVAASYKCRMRQCGIDKDA